MSRIGRQPIEIPSGVDVTVGEDAVVVVKGPRGELSAELPKERVTISPALNGIRLLGELRDRGGRPLFVFQPLQNRHLLVVAQR